MSVLAELKKLGDLFRGSRREAIHARVSEREVPDPIPVELPLGMGGPPSMRELVQEYVEGALSQRAEEVQMGTFEEEDDFEADDPMLLDLSGFEVNEYEMVEEEVEEGPVPAPVEPVEAAVEPVVEPETAPVKEE